MKETTKMRLKGVWMMLGGLGTFLGFFGLLIHSEFLLIIGIVFLTLTILYRLGLALIYRF